MRILTAAVTLALALLSGPATAAAHPSLRRRQLQPLQSQAEFTSSSSSGLLTTPRVASELLQYAFLYELNFDYAAVAGLAAAVADDGLEVGGGVLLKM